MKQIKKSYLVLIGAILACLAFIFISCPVNAATAHQFKTYTAEYEYRYCSECGFYTTQERMDCKCGDVYGYECETCFNIELNTATSCTYTDFTIVKQPQSASVFATKSARFTVTTNRTDVTYQWQYKNATSTRWLTCGLTGNKTASLSMTATAARNGYQFRCKITDKGGTVKYSNAAKLTIANISGQPASVTALLNANASFSVKTTGSVTYQWQYSKNNGTTWLTCGLTGNKTATLSMTATEERNGYQYRCKIKDTMNHIIYSNAATLTIHVPLNGLVQVGDNWYLYENDRIRTEFTGIASNEYGDWAIKNGQVDFTENGIIAWNDDKGTYAKMSGGCVDWGCTSVCYSDELGWVYVKNGIVQFDFTGIASNEYGDWAIKNGHVDFDENGVISWNDDKDPCTYAKMSGGCVDWGFTGLARGEDTLWYCSNGIVDRTYTGTYTLYEEFNYYASNTDVQITNGVATEFDRVFMGDSRTGCLMNAGQTGDGFICKWSMAYDYFVDTEIPQLENLITLMPNIKSVTINMGANDILHGTDLTTAKVQAIAADYVARVDELIAKYPNINFYYASVYHVEYSTYYTETSTVAKVNACNACIDTFNAYIKEHCNATYIDLQEYVTREGFTTLDGLHINDYQNGFVVLTRIRNYLVSCMTK